MNSRGFRSLLLGAPLAVTMCGCALPVFQSLDQEPRQVQIPKRESAIEPVVRVTAVESNRTHQDGSKIPVILAQSPSSAREQSFLPPVRRSSVSKSDRRRPAKTTNFEPASDEQQFLPPLRQVTVPTNVAATSVEPAKADPNIWVDFSADVSAASQTKNVSVIDSTATKPETTSDVLLTLPREPTQQQTNSEQPSQRDARSKNVSTATNSRNNVRRKSIRYRGRSRTSSRNDHTETFKSTRLFDLTDEESDSTVEETVNAKDHGDFFDDEDSTEQKSDATTSNPTKQPITKPLFGQKRSSKPDKTEAVSEAENQKIAEAIARTLRAAELDRHYITVEFKNGVAKLAGSVPDEKQIKKATRVVSRVKGVRWIDNQLEEGANVSPLPVSRYAAMPQRRPLPQPVADSRRPTASETSNPIRQVAATKAASSKRHHPVRRIDDEPARLRKNLRRARSATDSGSDRHYATLGVPRDASSREIARTYVQRAKQLNIDKHSQDPAMRQSAAQQLEELNVAFRALKARQQNESPAVVEQASHTRQEHQRAERPAPRKRAGSGRVVVANSTRTASYSAPPEFGYIPGVVAGSEFAHGDSVYAPAHLPHGVGGGGAYASTYDSSGHKWYTNPGTVYPHKKHSGWRHIRGAIDHVKLYGLLAHRAIKRESVYMPAPPYKYHGDGYYHTRWRRLTDHAYPAHEPYPYVPSETETAPAPTEVDNDFQPRDESPAEGNPQLPRSPLPPDAT